MGQFPLGHAGQRVIFSHIGFSISQHWKSYVNEKLPPHKETEGAVIL